MQFYQLIGLIICVQAIQYVSTIESTQSNSGKVQGPVEFPDVIIETILHLSGTQKFSPINVTQISTTIGYSQQKIHSTIDSLKGQHIYIVPENIMAFRSTVDVVFDTISQLINSLESSVDSTVCLGDLSVLEVKNALQVLMDVCISSNWGPLHAPNVQTFSSETVASSVYCLSSEIELFITSASNFARMANKSNDEVNQNVITGVQAIVESVLNIIGMVLHGLKEMKGQEQVFNNPSLKQLTSAIEQFTSQPFNISEGLTNNIISSLTAIEVATQSSMENLPLIMYGNIAKVLKDISDNQESIPYLNGTIEPIKSLHSDLIALSNSVHSTYKTTSAVYAAYAVDATSQNLIATITYLTYSVTMLPSQLIFVREFHELIQPNFQTNLLYIASNIQTLNDEIVVIVQRRLIYLICISPSVDKPIFEYELQELKSFIETIILIFEKVIKSSIKTVQSFMSCVAGINDLYNAFEYDVEAQTLFRDTKQLVNDLNRILYNESSTTTSTSAESSTSATSSTSIISSTSGNGFTICTKAFAEVAQSSIQLRSFFNKSIEQINRRIVCI